MKVFVGLGNPGIQYKNTRHNAGFLFLEFFSNLLNFPTFKERTSLHSQISKMTYSGDTYLLVKPSTYMNLSGIAVKAVFEYFKDIKKELIIIHDDLDIQFGNFKYSDFKSPRSHNGLISIKSSLCLENLKTIRIGIEAREGEQKEYVTGKDYVLSPFNEDEIKTLSQMVFPDIVSKLGIALPVH